MSNLLWIIMYSLLEFLNFAGCYKFIFNTKFKKDKWIYISTFLMVSFSQIIVIRCVDNSWVDVINILSGFLIPLFWIEGKKIKGILYYPIIVFGTSIINSCTIFFLSTLLNISVTKAMKLPLLVIIAECTAILIMVIYYVLIVKKKNSVRNLNFTNIQFVTIFIGMLCSGTVIACTQWIIKDGSIPENIKTLCGFAVSLVSVLFVIVSVWQGVVTIRKAEYKEQNAKYENYLKLQEEHIKMLINKDESLRRFKHDIHAHMIALKAYAEKAEDIELKNYICDIVDHSETFAVKQYTGHSAIDAVISELFIEGEKKDISMEWQGKIAISKVFTIYDMCVIFSNLLSNGIEASEKVSDEKKRFVKVNVLNCDDKIYINIKNSWQPGEFSLDNMDNLKTTKVDKEHHGFGIKNVKNTILKYKGSINYSANNEYVEVEVLI